MTLPLVVTEVNAPTLLGRNWLEALRLDWRTIFCIGKSLTLQQVLDRHADVFKEELGKLKGTTAKIYIEKHATPWVEKACPVPFAIRHKVEQELDRLQALGIIQPVQFSDWASPIVPVMKPDGAVRICRSRRLVTINTHKGLFEYTRLPFGIASAPSIFQRLMENLLQGIPRVCVYLDDILVSGTTEQEHLANLEQVLERLESAGMKLKRPKCAFLLNSVAYLGHEISAEGLHTTKAKVKAIVDAQSPRNLTELRSFLGMVNYYGKFLPNLASTLAPLYELLRQTKAWKWGPRQRKAFRQVKGLLQSNKVLTHFDNQLPLLLETPYAPLQ
jgi:hypothetical protein